MYAVPLPSPMQAYINTPPMDMTRIMRNASLRAIALGTHIVSSRPPLSTGPRIAVRRDTTASVLGRCLKSESMHCWASSE